MKMTKIAALDFDLAKTLDSGQVFHWDRIDGGFCGMIGNEPVYVEQRGEGLFATSDAHLIRNYFALDHPLAEICASFPNDPTTNAARQSCRGLRIIRQPKWECLATFICSSMKQVAHIRQISRNLRERFGEGRTIRLQRSIQNSCGGSAAPQTMLMWSASPRATNIEQRTARSTNVHTVYTFPAPERIALCAEKELRECRLGYRAKNLLASARLVASREARLEKWAALGDNDLRTKLSQLPGVGAKVANCVMLFAYERLRAFPIDVWIERVLKENYFPRARKLNAARLRMFTEEYFGEHGGYAQQYLFHHARTSGRAGALRPTPESSPRDEAVRLADFRAARGPAIGMTKGRG